MPLVRFSRDLASEQVCSIMTVKLPAVREVGWADIVASVLVIKDVLILKPLWCVLSEFSHSWCEQGWLEAHLSVLWIATRTTEANYAAIKNPSGFEPACCHVPIRLFCIWAENHRRGWYQRWYHRWLPSNANIPPYRITSDPAVRIYPLISSFSLTKQGWTHSMMIQEQTNCNKIAKSG